ncbi:MAG: sulfatase-like hydrolase/transferase [Phycisphaera sp.]|nr:sulfatase-like hydrolase/transferase [Phycisphaera sp.]
MRTLRAALVVVIVTWCGIAHAADRPNFLIIMADDCTHSDLAVYGGRNAKTPHLDRFASQGLVFNRAYLAEAMCQPCRAELYSGRFPMGNGCAWNHSASIPTITTMPQHLGALGYRVGIAGKIHVGPKKAFPFEMVGGYDRSCVHNPTQPHNVADVKAFMSTKQGDKPFCLVICLVEPHRPWVMGDASQYPPDKIQLPPNIADTEQTRKEYGAYLAEITYMDGQVGEILDALDDSGHADDTLVLFSSEQGSQFPGNKWTNWDTGVHTALIARWPGRTPVHQRTDAIVMYADVLPTLVDLAGGDPASHHYDGTSFQQVLLGKADTHRTYAYTEHNNVPEGTPYPVRGVTDGTFRYVRNLTPDAAYFEKHLMAKGTYWTTWVDEESTDARTHDLIERFVHRPAEQLYNTSLDPYEMVNLADDPKHAAIKAKLSAELDRWLKAQGDPGVAQDTQEAYEASKHGNHLYRAPE